MDSRAFDEGILERNFIQHRFLVVNLLKWRVKIINKLKESTILKI